MSSFITTQSFNLATYQKGNELASKLALVLPGLLDTKDYPHMQSHVDLLAEEGYLAVSFDPPGTWESSDDINLYTITNYLQAIHELIEYFNNKPTILVGHSLGGRLAMLAAINNPQVTAFVAIMSAITPIRASNAHKNDQWKKDGVRTSYRDIPHDPNQKRQFTLPYSFLEDAATYNLDEGLRKLTKPKLFIAGTQDLIVPTEEIKAVYDIAAEPKQIKTINCGHDYRREPKLIDEVNQLIINFLA